MSERTEAVDRDRHGQWVSSSIVGDCFRACMSVVLNVPNGDHMPNPHGPDSMFEWRSFLADMGLAVMHGNPQGPIWKSHPWIASVPSKNHEGCTHAIVMRHVHVLFDPSPKRRYRTRTSLLGANVVLGGTWLEVSDASRLRHFIDWQAAHGRTRTLLVRRP